MVSEPIEAEHVGGFGALLASQIDLSFMALPKFQCKKLPILQQRIVALPAR
jgi:hypothetical protein